MKETTTYFARDDAAKDRNEKRVQLGAVPNVRIKLAGSGDTHDYVPFMKEGDRTVAWTHYFSFAAGVVAVSVTEWRREDPSQHDWQKGNTRLVRYYSPSHWGTVEGTKDEPQKPTRAPKAAKAPTPKGKKPLGQSRPEGATGLPRTRPTH